MDETTPAPQSPSSSAAATAPDSKTEFEFEVGEKVFALHGSLMYEAKIIKTEMRKLGDDVIPQYKVHYQGWKKTHDEWLDSSRIVRFTKQNIEQAEQLKAAAASSTVKDGRKSQKKSSPASDSEAGSSTSGKRQKIEPSPVSRETELSTPTIVIELSLPSKLRNQLIEDWQAVTEEKKIVNLPAKISVKTILERFEEHQKRKSKDGEASEVSKFVHDVRVYFNTACGSMLLYRQERKQYHDLHRKLDQSRADGEDSKLEAADLFGVEHLLRLFVKFPELLAQTDMTEAEIATARQFITDFVKFIGGKNQDHFNNSYIPAFQWKLQEQS
eukprot:c8910_g1_i1.p1 GENE.c8910_g1_i1~~c8910_g1_i1.p1  ORF type:complete len:347 (-),score=94.73 c8910_g1_i1:212-1195(-)